MSPLYPLRAPERGEAVKLGPPAAGEVIITVDPASAGTTFSAGTQTFLPGAQMPVHRHRNLDLVLFVSKGQGRVTLEKQVLNVVPGAMLHVPRNTWCGVRNTGTGTLQIAWASSPGLEAWFRDLSRLGGSPSAQALQELAQRHGVEFRPAGDEPPSTPAGPRRSHRRGGRHRGRRGPAQSGTPASSVTPSPVPAERSPTPTTAPATPAAPGAPSGHRRRHRRRGGAPSASPSVSTPGSPPPPATGRRRSSPSHYRRRVKEVYMGGRWVRVEGEGPVIAPGREGSERRSSKGDDDDAPPPIRLSVSL